MRQLGVENCKSYFVFPKNEFSTTVDKTLFVECTKLYGVMNYKLGLILSIKS